MLQLFGTIDNPLNRISNNPYGELENGGLVNFISNVIKTIILAAGVFALINLVLAGFQYISSSGNTEATTQAWQKIYMSLIGLVVMVAAFAITAVAGQLLFGSWTAILNPQIFGPGDN